MLTQLSQNEIVVGAKQVKRALEAGTAKRVFLASDADPRITGPIQALCAEKGVEIQGGATMKELGKACSIAVGAAVAAILA